MKRLLFILLILSCTYSIASAQQWSESEPAGTQSVSDIDTLIGNNNTATERMFVGINTISIHYDSASQLTASQGAVAVSSSGNVALFLRNTSTTTITWADIDTGAEAAATTYYVYAIAASASSETATFKISTSSSAPSGVTYYKKIGSFYNNSSSDIERYKVYTNAYEAQPTDSSGIKSVTAIFDYGTSSSSFTAKTGDLKFAFGQASIGANSTASITNLPFTSSSTYKCWATFDQDVTNDDGFAGCTPSSASAMTVINQQGAGTRTVQWGAVGY